MAEETEKAFLSLVARTPFAGRYYELCRCHPMLSHQAARRPKKEILEVLSEIGQLPKWDARDRSYSFDLDVGGWAVRRGFVIQHHALIEFWLSATRGASRIGSNYAVVAHDAAKNFAPEAVQYPPYPRPHFYSREQLKEILRECFQLSDLLRSVLEKCPHKMPTNPL